MWSGAGDAARSCLIALHGLGQNGSSILHKLNPLHDRGIHLVAPDGPHRHEVRGPDGIREGHAWYIYTGDQQHFLASLLESEQDLLGIVKTVQQESGVKPEETVLLGFSQGGYLAGFVACRHPELFGGCVISSARLKHEFLSDEIARGDLPRMLFLHDKADPLTGPDPVLQSVDHLEKASAQVELCWHQDGHRLGDGAISSLQDWLQRNRLID